MSDLEATFANWWHIAGGPELVREHRFAPPRRWRGDFAHLGTRVAIECEGGVYSGGRHVRGRGFEADAEKYNALSAAGWILFRITPGMLAADPMGTLAPIMATVRSRSGRGVATAARRTASVTPRNVGDPKEEGRCGND
jgi:very-short-patch-repair endonuclease